ncbi:MAG: hypothetical protein QOJ64_731 [Acidobacteriota bacterium]|jgi:hypothetical protein|nr:hypothetical protein [Acidobacteriota bacterium]
MFLPPSETRTLIPKAIICLAFLLFAQSAFACLCSGGSRKSVFNRARNQATVIFVGRAVDVHNGITHGEFPGWRVKLKVDRYWKGLVTDEMIIFTGPSDCASYFRVGDDYLVFAYVPSDTDHLYTDVCMQTGPIGLQAYNLKRLGIGKRLR